MINVWDYVDSKKVKIIEDIEGREFNGNVICVMDSDKNNSDEDNITIQVNKDTIVSFFRVK